MKLLIQLVANCLNLVGFLCLPLGLVPIEDKCPVSHKGCSHLQDESCWEENKSPSYFTRNRVNILNVVYSTTGSTIKEVVLCQKLFATQGGYSVSVF